MAQGQAALDATARKASSAPSSSSSKASGLGRGRCSAAPQRRLPDGSTTRFSHPSSTRRWTTCKTKAFDAIYLSLHGAGVTTKREDPEVELLRAIRKIQPTVPIGASFDLHGNLANELAHYLTTGSVYRTYPHIDMRETAWRVLSVLERTVAGEIKPVCRISTKAYCCRVSTCAPRTGRCATCRSSQ